MKRPYATHVNLDLQKLRIYPYQNTATPGNCNIEDQGAARSKMIASRRLINAGSLVTAQQILRTHIVFFFPRTDLAVAPKLTSRSALAMFRDLISGRLI